MTQRGGPSGAGVKMNSLERVHERYLFGRRIQILSTLVAERMPHGARVLDVGCGDGSLAQRLLQRRPDVRLEGVDTLVRAGAKVRVTGFDGDVLPFEAASFEVVLLVDTLHHARDPLGLLRESARVARESLVIKDHTCDGLWAAPTLRLMDRIGNARHGVALPFQYWPTRRWMEAFQQVGLRVASWTPHLHLYPWPASLWFDRSLHFLAQLDVSGAGRPRAAEKVSGTISPL